MQDVQAMAVRCMCSVTSSMLTAQPLSVVSIQALDVWTSLDLYVLWLCRPDIKQLLRHTHVYCVTPEAVNGKARLNVENADGQPILRKHDPQ